MSGIVYDLYREKRRQVEGPHKTSHANIVQTARASALLLATRLTENDSVESGAYRQLLRCALGLTGFKSRRPD